MAPPPVLLVSIDGVAPAEIDPTTMPNLLALAEVGASCFDARTIEPCWTLPAHLSMVRGVAPSVHGVFDNTPVPPATDVSSVLGVARRAGRVTAAVHNWSPFDVLFDAGDTFGTLFVDRGYDPHGDAAMAEATTWFVAHTGADVVFSYFAGPDLAGHEYGWGSEAYRRALGRADAALGDLLAELAGWRVIVTTDHGGLGTNHGGLSDAEMTTFVVVAGPGVPSGRQLGEASILDVAPTVAALAEMAPDPHWVGASLVTIA
ncbi:MAG: alkaline phosphatase family protein [Actinomycetota bacterium]